MVEAEEEKNPEIHFATPGIWTHDLSLLSRVLYPLEHGALPNIRSAKRVVHQKFYSTLEFNQSYQSPDHLIVIFQHSTKIYHGIFFKGSDPGSGSRKLEPPRAHFTNDRLNIFSKWRFKFFLLPPPSVEMDQVTIFFELFWARSIEIELTPAIVN